MEKQLEQKQQVQLSIQELVQQFSSQGKPCPMLIEEVLKLPLGGSNTIQELRAWCASQKNTDTDARRRRNWQQLFVKFSQNLVTVCFKSKAITIEGDKSNLENCIAIALEHTGLSRSEIEQIWVYDSDRAKSPGERSLA